MILLGTASAVNFNLAGDTPIPVLLPAGYLVKSLLVGNLSAPAANSLNCGLYTGPGQTGTKLSSFGGSLRFPGGQTVTEITTAAVGTTETAYPIESGSTLYVNVIAANGSPLTGDVWIFGELWPPVLIRD